MSLKAFHLFFIFASIVLMAGFGFWGVIDFRNTGSSMNLILGIASFFCSAGLSVYGAYALRKYKDYSYL